MKKQIEQNEFIDRLFGVMSFGLPKEEAEAIVNSGKEYADFFERTALAAMYESYKKSGMVLDLWAINHPMVDLKKYADKADNKEFFKKLA